MKCPCLHQKNTGRLKCGNISVFDNHTRLEILQLLCTFPGTLPFRCKRNKYFFCLNNLVTIHVRTASVLQFFLESRFVVSNIFVMKRLPNRHQSDCVFLEICIQEGITQKFSNAHNSCLLFEMQILYIYKIMIIVVTVMFRQRKWFKFCTKNSINFCYRQHILFQKRKSLQFSFHSDPIFTSISVSRIKLTKLF